MNKLRLSVGEVLIERYQVEGFLAAGGMQEVHVCFDHVLGRRVVIKTPKDGVKDRRFRRGAEMGARVNHPNIAATFDYYEDEKITFLVEELIDGLDLGKRLDNEFFFMDPFLAAHVLHHIARALHEAHRAGICHRDLKPSNIMTSADASVSQIKLTDFGIAKLAETEIAVEMERFDKDASTLTSSHTLLGAVPYMAPECWANWRAAGQPMDVWALGCIGYQLLTGEPPFGYGRAAIANVIRAEQQGKIELSQPNWFGKHPSTAKIEQELWELIISCICLDPSLRPKASSIASACDNLCYAAAPRRLGNILEFGIRYPSGSISKTGNIRDNETGASLFFHGSEFFGQSRPSPGYRVNYGVYPGMPKARLAPVLQLRQPR